MAWTTSKCVLEDTPLKIPEEFSFPFQPYQIQVDFMKALFSALDNKRLGIFESPTGTVWVLILEGMSESPVHVSKCLLL